MQAEDVVVAMGSGCGAIESAVESLLAQGQKVGLVKVSPAFGIISHADVVYLARLACRGTAVSTHAPIPAC